MGLFLRKALSVGPVRINLSKSGFGTSVGVKGARLSSGPSGVHVFAGRNGMYYRKSLNSKTTKHRTVHAQQTQSSTTHPSNTGLAIVLIILSIIIFSYLRSFAKPIVQYSFAFLFLGIGVTYFLALRKQKSAIKQYEEHLKTIFNSTCTCPNERVKSQNLLFKKALPTSSKYKFKIKEIQQKVYERVIEKSIQAEGTLENYSSFMTCAEELLGLPASYYLSVKKDILNATYLQAISDRYISDEEETEINNLINGLMIPITEIQKELSVLEDIKKAQSLTEPLQAILRDELPFPVTRNESVFLVSSAQVYTRRKSSLSLDGYEYTQKRDGDILVTSKKLIVRDSGNTVIKLSEIENIEIDIDRNMVFIFKSTSGKPSIIAYDYPVYLGRLIDLLLAK